MALNEPSLDFHVRMLEASFHVPHESIKRNLKTVQKLEEKQFKKNDELAKELSRCRNKKDQLARIKQLVTSMKLYEKKMKARVAAEKELMERILARIEKLKQLKEIRETEHSDDDLKKMDELHQNKLLKWYRDQTNLLIADYLLKNNPSTHSNPGLLLLKNLGFEKLVDHDIIMVSNRISTSILNKDLTELITWINDNKSYLKKVKSSLEFEARFQQYIELVKHNEIPKALQVFDEHLTPFTDSNFEEIKVASGMLVFTNKILQSPDQANYDRYSHLLSSDRYKDISNLFLQIFYRMYGIPEDDPLLVYLSIGISSLKTRSCTCSSVEEPLEFESILTQKLNTPHNEQVQNSSCPVCALEFQQLSEQLPYSHTVKSHLFDNPVMLPNGNVFDKLKLVSYAELQPDVEQGKIVDPITFDKYDSDEMVTMYPA